jgi:hypothetical protein
MFNRGRDQSLALWIVRNHSKNCLEVIQGYAPGQVYEESGPFAKGLGLLLSQVDGPFFDSTDAALKLQWWREQHEQVKSSPTSAPLR